MQTSVASLKSVTLCAIDCVTHKLAARALDHSSNKADFGNVILFSDTPVRFSGHHVQIPALSSRAAYSEFVLRNLIEHIETPFVLIAQWDGYVLDQKAWSDDFLNFDYIGAKWDWFDDGANVGNGGFSLRSRRLLEKVAKEYRPGNSETANEDIVICRLLRPILEENHGLRFAPAEIADRFSYERTSPLEPTFGFHGLFNFWRHVEDTTILELPTLLPESILRGREYLELMLVYFQLGKFSVFSSLFDRSLSVQTSAALHQSLRQLTNNEKLAERLVALGLRMQNR